MSEIIGKTPLTEKILQDARTYLPTDILDYINECMQKEHSDSYLIAVLHKVQKHFGYVPQKAIHAVAYLMNIPASKISGAASFYHLFHLEERGKYIISVCTGTACYVKGSDKIMQQLQSELGITNGETTIDGMFSLEEARCLGMCALAPVMKINDDIYTNVTPDKVKIILQKYLDKES